MHSRPLCEEKDVSDDCQAVDATSVDHECLRKGGDGCIVQLAHNEPGQEGHDGRDNGNRAENLADLVGGDASREQRPNLDQLYRALKGFSCIVLPGLRVLRKSESLDDLDGVHPRPDLPGQHVEEKGSGRGGGDDHQAARLMPLQAAGEDRHQDKDGDHVAHAGDDVHLGELGRLEALE